MKNFVGVRSFRKDIKPCFRFYSAPLGEVVEAEVQYRAGGGRQKRGYYLYMTVKTLQADGCLVWMPFSAPQVNVLLGEGPRFNLATLQGFALQLDAAIPDLAAAWLRYGSGGIGDAVCAVIFESPAPTLAL